MLTETPLTPSTAGEHEAPAFASSSESVFVDYTEANCASVTPTQWCENAKEKLNNLWESIRDADDTDPSLDPQRMHPLTLYEEVEHEIQRVLRKQVLQPATIDVIEQRTVGEPSSTLHLKSLDLSKHYADPKFEKYFRNLKIQLPQLNGAPPITQTSNDMHGVVTMQFYKTSSRRDVKLIEIDVPLHLTLLDVFTFVCSQLPNNYMFDGPLYAGSGLMAIGHDMYITGEEDYSVPIVDWLGPNVPVTVSRMESCIVGQALRLTEVCIDNSCGFLIFNGDEELRMYVSNVKLSSSITSDSATQPILRFKRKISRITRCVLCKTTAADLIILNDVMLPLNPSHCCARCYRRLRADRSGQFVTPPPDVLVSLYRQI